MYSMLTAWDWNVMSRLAYETDCRRLGSRFPLELGADLILSPHLYGWRDAKPFLSRGTRGHRGREEYFTLDEAPDFVLYVARGEAYRRFLQTELAPALPLETTLVIVDPSSESFAAPARDAALPPARLPAYLGRLLHDDRLFEASCFEDLLAPWGDSIHKPSDPPHDEVAARAIEHAPVRLWETFLWRGHAHRWELVAGEVPLIGELPTTLAANRSLLRCVQDAETWTETRAVESGGWIVVGGFRMRQVDTTLEIRARLTPPDIRVGFMPTWELAGADELPTLAGVLTAGGDNGKVEWMNGYNWSTVHCEVAGEAPRLAERLRQTLTRLGAPRVDVEGYEEREFPDDVDGRWLVRHDDRMLTLYMPLYRDEKAAYYALR